MSEKNKNYTKEQFEEDKLRIPTSEWNRLYYGEFSRYRRESEWILYLLGNKFVEENVLGKKRDYLINLSEEDTENE